MAYLKNSGLKNISYPPGHVLQQVNTKWEITGGDVTTTSPSWATSGFLVTITPLFATSDIWMMFHLN